MSRLGAAVIITTAGPGARRRNRDRRLLGLGYPAHAADVPRRRSQTNPAVVEKSFASTAATAAPIADQLPAAPA